jgi:hypothetical protein
MHIRISFHECLDLLGWRNEATPAQSYCTFRRAAEYRKECSAVFVMIEWNVLLSENTDSGCFLCRLFEPHSPVRGSFASFFRDAALPFVSDLTQYHAIDIHCRVPM